MMKQFRSPFAVVRGLNAQCWLPALRGSPSGTGCGLAKPAISNPIFQAQTIITQLPS